LINLLIFLYGLWITSLNIALQVQCKPRDCGHGSFTIIYGNRIKTLLNIKTIMFHCEMSWLLIKKACTMSIQKIYIPKPIISSPRFSRPPFIFCLREPKFKREERNVRNNEKWCRECEMDRPMKNSTSKSSETGSNLNRLSLLRDKKGFF
jgi:hypothetical protein